VTSGEDVAGISTYNILEYPFGLVSSIGTLKVTQVRGDCQNL